MEAKTLIFPEANCYELQNTLLPPLGAQDVLVRTLVTAPSPGTERWTLRGLHAGTKFPVSPGYHRIGIVEGCGSEVTTLKTGDIVYGGNHTSHSVKPASSHIFLSETMLSDYELESLCFTILACVARRGIDALTTRPANKMLIIGAGILGLCAAQMAERLRVRATLLDVNPLIGEFVKRKFPQFKLISPQEDGWLDELKAIAPEGFESLYDTVGHRDTTDAVIPLVRTQGEMMMQSQYFNHEKRAINLDMVKIRELTIKTTCGITPESMRKTIEQIWRRDILITPMITHRFKSAEIIKAFELLDKNREFNLGMVIDWR